MIRKIIGLGKLDEDIKGKVLGIEILDAKKNDSTPEIVDTPGVDVG